MYPNKVLTNRIFVAYYLIGNGQNYFRPAFPILERDIFWAIYVNLIEDAFNSHVALRALIVFWQTISYYILINVIYDWIGY